MTDDKDGRTDARTEATRLDGQRIKRLTAAALNEALARKRCSHCATRGAWTVYSEESKGKRVRYVRCRGCGHTDKVPVMAKEEAGDETQTPQT